MRLVGGGWGDWLKLAALSCALSVLIRWPLSGQPWLFPLDGNSGLHALAVDAAYHGSWTRIPGLIWPEGAPVRLLAVPTLLLGMALRWLCEPSTALEIARTVWLAASGLGVALLAARLGLGLRGRAVAVTLALASPITLAEAAGGRHEQHAYLPISLAIAGALGSGRINGFLVVLGLLLAGFSTPYQFVPAAVLAFVAAAANGRKSALVVTASTLVVGAAVAAYYAGAVESPSLFGQPMVVGGTPHYLLGLVAPVHTVTSPPLTRLTSLFQGAHPMALGACWPSAPAYNPEFLGWVPLALGAAGAVWGGSKLRPLILGGSLCTLLALGSYLHLSPTTTTHLPLPWALTEVIPGLRNMHSTGRFLTGTVLVLALAAGAVAERWRILSLLAPLAIVETLLFAPTTWPLAAAKFDTAALRAMLPASGALAVWPAPGLPPAVYPVTALLTGHALAGSAAEQFRPIHVDPVGTDPPEPLASALPVPGLPVLYFLTQRCAPVLQWRDRDPVHDACIDHVCVHLTTPPKVEKRAAPLPPGRTLPAPVTRPRSPP